MMLHAHWRGHLPSRPFLAQQPSSFRQPATGSPHPIDGSSSEIRAKNVEQNSALVDIEAARVRRQQCGGLPTVGQWRDRIGFAAIR